ncbi:MAG TPA: ThiF family adenylyltransferase [Verrucomicrobiota bacterium]|nr:hypothetical protein [Verrucomicrobiales bacterium]HRI12783.1 ThiF family adenylyltransferase [Verrucomicrobiota bacterium]
MDHEYYKRVSPLLDVGRLTSLRIVVIGLRSGGADIAVEFGRLGVSLFLTDLADEKIEGHNVIRHVLGAGALGRIKHEAMAEHIRNLNPAAAVLSAGFDAVADLDTMAAALKDFSPHLIFAATDNEESKFAIDSVGREQGITVVGGGVYDGGVGGEVYVSDGGGACYGCITRFIRGTKRPRAAQRRHDYSSVDLPELRATAALKLDIAQIASICVRFGLQRLLSPDQDRFGVLKGANLAIFANHRVPGIFERPLSAQFFAVTPQAQCLVCAPASEQTSPTRSLSRADSPSESASPFPHEEPTGATP